MKSLLKSLGVLALLFVSLSLHAQSSFLIPVQNTLGQAITGAMVQLTCTDTVGGCFGKGPFTAFSSSGNATFTAIPMGNYTVTVSGAGVSLYSYSYTVGPSPLTAPLKPAASDNIQCVSPNGNDSNDGLSLGACKLTPSAAQATLFNAGTGGYIFVMGGTYTLSSTFNLRSNTYLYCESSVVITEPSSTVLSLGLISLAGSDHATIDNCAVDGNRAGNTDGGSATVQIMLSGSTNATVKNSRVRNSNNAGIYTGTATNPTITGNYFTNCWGGCLQLGFTGSTVATGGTIKDNTFTGLGNLVGSFSDGNVISGNKITGYAQSSHVTTSGTSVTWVSGTTFTNVSPGMYICITGVEYQVTAVGSSTALTVLSSAGSQTNVLSIIGTPDSLNLADSSNNTVTGNTINTSEGYGIAIYQDGQAEASLHNVVSANIVTKTGGTCIAVNSIGSSPITGGTDVGGNSISDCGQGGTAKGSNNREAIEINGAGTHYTFVGGNDIYDDQMSPTTLFGVIAEAGAPTDQVLDENSIVGMVTAAIGGGLAPSVSSGFGTSPSIVQQNGPKWFEVNVGTGGVATSGVILLPTALHGWSCSAIDMNTNIVTRETAFTTTTVTLTAASAWTASDKLLLQCGAF